MKRSSQICIGIAGGFLLLITLWPVVVMPGELLRSVMSLFTDTITFGQRAAGILVTVFVLALLCFGIALLFYAFRTNTRTVRQQHTTTPLSQQIWLRPGEQLFLRIVFLSFLLGVINIASLFGSIIITVSLFDFGPISPGQILVQVPATAIITVLVFSFLVFILCLANRNWFKPKKVWELFAIFCLTVPILFILQSPIESYLSSDLDGIAIFQVFWPVLAATNVLALLSIRMLFMKIRGIRGCF